MNTKTTNQSRRIWKGLFGVCRMMRRKMILRFSDHVADCPRCQGRLAKIHRVEVALMLMKTQPQPIRLLAKANIRALDVLKHSLRHAPQSAALRTARSDLGRLEKMRPGLERALSAAACLFVALMIKTGVSRTLLDYREQGEAAIHSYYARNLDNHLLNELFPTESSPAEKSV